MIFDYLDKLFGTNQSSEDANNVLPSDPKEVITISGKGDGYDYFGQLINHAKSVIISNQKNSRRPTSQYLVTDTDREYKILLKAITEPIELLGAYIDGNSINIQFSSKANPDVTSSYDAKQYAGDFDTVYIEVHYHISELLIKKNNLYIVRTINTRSEWPVLKTFRYHDYGKYEITENRFFVQSGNVRSSTVKRVGLNDAPPASNTAAVIEEKKKEKAKPETKKKRKPDSSYIKGGWTRHDAFSRILHDFPPRTEYHAGDIVVLNVRFNSYGHIYCYRAKDDVYKPGDIVEVKVSGAPKAVVVDSVGYYSEEEYPFEVVQLNYVEGMATGELAERYKEAIEAETSTEAEREKIRTAAMKELSTARKEREKATKMHDEATEARREAEQKKKEAEKAIKETKEAGEKARQAEARLEAAKKEAAKTWKRRRPKTDNDVIKSLRKVQDALDEDEQIFFLAFCHFFLVAGTGPALLLVPAIAFDCHLDVSFNYLYDPSRS